MMLIGLFCTIVGTIGGFLNHRIIGLIGAGLAGKKMKKPRTLNFNRLLELTNISSIPHPLLTPIHHFNFFFVALFYFLTLCVYGSIDRDSNGTDAHLKASFGLAIICLLLSCVMAAASFFMLNRE